MNRKLALNTVIWSILLTGLGAAVVYFNPQLMQTWAGPALLAAPSVAGLCLFFASRVTEEQLVSAPKAEAEGARAPEPERETEEARVPEPEPEPEPEPSGPPPEVTVAQILGLLQREGRLIDFLQEDIDPYDDAQIGAAVREVHRGCSAALKEVLGLEPVIHADEGAVVEIDEDFDPARIKLVGRVHGKPPFKGVLRHSGWRFSRMSLPEWTGRGKTDVLAPAEVEVQ